MNDILIIAEISANHGNSIEVVKDSIAAAKSAGANAVKIQTYTADAITLNSDSKDFVIKGESLWVNQKLYDLYQEGAMPYEWTAELYDYAKELGIILFSTPFDIEGVELLESVDNPIYKVASFEITHIPLLKRIAETKKPVIISTGIATLEEITRAVNIFKDAGVQDITLLKCTSSYPAQISDANLAMMNYFKDQFAVNVGVSDHTLGYMVPTVAVALGAKVVEKHFILDKSIESLDKDFSMDPDEFAIMVKHIKDSYSALGQVSFKGIEEKESRTFRRSIYVAQDVEQGQIITEENIKVVRPGYGLDTKYYYDILGQSFNKNMHLGDRLTLDDIIKGE